MIARFTAITFVLSALLVAGCDKGPTPGAQANATAPMAAKPTSAETPAPASEPEGKVYGEGVSNAEAVAIADLLKDPSAYKGKKVRVEGMVTDVCPKRGCWFEMAGNQTGQKLRFKVQDGVMVFPMDAKGQHAVAEGVVAVRELNMDESKEYAAYQAEEMGKEFDPSSVTEPITIVRLDGTGAVLSDKK